MSSLVQIMGCRLFGDNPLSKPMIVYYQLDHKEQISIKFYLKFKKVFIQENAFEDIVCWNGGHLVLASMC